MFQFISDYVYQNPAIAAVCVSALVAICLGVYIRATLPYYILNGAFIFFLIYAGIFNLDIEFSSAVGYYIVIVAVITVGIHNRVSWWYYALAAVLLFIWLFVIKNIPIKKHPVPVGDIRVGILYEGHSVASSASLPAETPLNGASLF